MTNSHQLTDYHDAVLDFMAANKYGKQKEDNIYREFEAGPLTRQNIKSLLRGLKQLGFIKPVKIPQPSIHFLDKPYEPPPTDAGYEITQLGKSHIARKVGQSGTVYSNITNSNIAHGSTNTDQSITVSELSIDIQEKIKELEKATKNKDSSAMKKTFGYIADKSVDVAIAILAGRLLQ